jgi:hypothetical protein
MARFAPHRATPIHGVSGAIFQWHQTRGPIRYAYQISPLHQHRATATTSKPFVHVEVSSSCTGTSTVGISVHISSYTSPFFPPPISTLVSLGHPCLRPL